MTALRQYCSAALLAVTLGMTGCLDVAEQRAHTDTAVGRASASGNDVEVESGFAAVRRFEPGSLELWGNAPAFKVRLSTSDVAPSQWTIVVRNVLPNVTLTARSGNGDDIAMASEPSTFSTERRVTLGIPPGQSIDFQLRPPDLESSEPFEFLEFADVQEAIDRVGDIYAKMNQESAARFVVMAGDLTRRGSAEELERFQYEQGALSLPIFVTLGNHELGSGEVRYHEYFGRGSQSFDFHGARFTLLDDASATLDPLVYGWLDDWLARGKNGVHLLFMHIPPLDPIGLRDGAFSSRAEAAKLIARLGHGNVDMTFYGHIHSYYAFENAGIPAFISGGGGAIPERFDGIGRHYLAVAVDPEQQRVTTRVVRVD